MKSYQDAETALKGRESRKLVNNTYLKRRSADTIAVMLHATDVVTYHADGRVVLNTGGWKTVTTKDRIKRYARIKLWTERGVWYVSSGDDWDKDATFQEGMTIHPDGRLEGTGKPPENLTKIKRAISKYAKGYIEALKAGKVEPPGPGDCFFCAMHEVKTGKPLGEVSHDTSHIQSHLDESYYVPSLAVNAMARLGASQACQWAFQACVTGETHPFNAIGLEQLQKVIRRYVSQQLGYQA